MGEYKLSDLENLSPLQRKCIMKNNKSLFPESSEQISFLIKALSGLLTHEIILVEAYDVFIHICEILEKLSQFYLLNTANMTMFCFAFEDMFEYFKKQNSYKKQKIYLGKYDENIEEDVEDEDEQVIYTPKGCDINIVVKNFAYNYTIKIS